MEGYPGCLLPRRNAEGVDQQEAMSRAGLQKIEAVIVTAAETMGTEHSLPGNVVCPDTGVEVTKVNLLVRPRQNC
ncbi:unnamed protein product [Schistocephalus solidus]|uniref:Endopeptidase La n=1 Tax=Schistocephalus solidus TaxID=70667 RepID=A0A183TPV3_SCHSO|nr:unnamed protein product [Schistocephalus solidus]